MPVTINGSGQVIVQIQSVTKVDGFTSSSSSFADITGLTVNITPTSASNRIYIFANVLGSATSWSNGPFGLNLVRNGTNICQGTGASNFNASSFLNLYANNDSNTADNMANLVVNFVDSPATTSTLTYKLQGRTQTGGTWAINQRASGTPFIGTSTITVMEISG